MSDNNTEFHFQSNEDFYRAEQQGDDFVDLEQINQFQPEVAPRSTTTAMTDLYASAQSESNRYREQGDPDEYDARFENQ